jgi:hypothetical protein
MEAVHTSETWVYFNETKWRYIPESSHLHARCHENLKFHMEGRALKLFSTIVTLAHVIYNTHFSMTCHHQRLLYYVLGQVFCC